ncbi:tripartite tricarboxylate transporter TctB family protein [Terrihabitans soli]|nr:tripartite tricarboxylate transporter TctB family protein [Terrihabitans soli]
MIVRDWNRVLCGLIFLAVAALHYWQGYELDTGSLFRMGPGMFPLMLETGLAFLGILAIIGGLRFDGEPLDAIGWRGVGMIVIAVLAFVFVTKYLGLVPGLAAVVVIAAYASPLARPVPTLLLTAFLVLFCVGVFHWGIGLPVPLFGMNYGG